MCSEQQTSKIALVLEYEGTQYCGFQYQARLPTVQGELEKAITKLTGEHRRIHGASRTDAGVHACGQVVSFQTNARYTPNVFRNALNYYLPEDIAVRESCQIEEDFDVRRGAISREYQYRILNRGVRSPFRCRWAHHVPQTLDIEVMNQACQQLVGTHDFASFVTDYEKGSTKRTIHAALFERLDEMVIFHVTGNSFLAHQVRNSMGMLLQIGLGKLGVDRVGSIVSAKIPGLAGPTAPPQGLYLTKVNYPQPLGVMQ
ncbi:MAG: tRNA pseudouridine(38-40) synthase TruA [Dehalococcoidia bacterium]|nr:tRNA pseudouridine(38-40) synthase TruA [Dehalococcoidia bacterium]